MKLSEKGAAFIAAHEGVVTKAYRDPVGILTIGIGFTMRSQSFARYWRDSRGRDLRLGDTMTRAECEKVLVLLVEEEFGPPVAERLPNIKQHQYDAAVSYLFNCGPDAIKDRWVQALAKGDVSGAAALLRTSRTTARGKRLQGLINRRKDEAKLLESGNYGKGAVTRTSRVDLIIEAQKLLAVLGYDVGDADGVEGAKTKAAVLAYQKTKPDLVDDGVIGPATVSALRVDARAKGGAQVPETPKTPDSDERPPVTPTKPKVGLWGFAFVVLIVLVALAVKFFG